MEDKMIRDEELSIVSGGVLQEGWEGTLLQVMRLYKIKFGEEGKQKTKDTMSVGLKDPTANLDEADMMKIYPFIDDNWDQI